MQVIEKFLKSKTGQDDGGEDALVVTDDFACVVDGATSQSDVLWEGKTGGRMAAETVCAAIRTLAADMDAQAAVAALADAIFAVYRQAGVAERMASQPLDRATASVVIYSRHHRQIWFVGDCQALVLTSGGKQLPLTHSKRVDEINAAARSLYLAAEICAGADVEQLRRDDPGRRFITELLRRQRQFQNARLDSEYSYWVLDGFAVDPRGIRSEPLPADAAQLVLASDGYPRLLPTHEESERFLQQVITRDPLLIAGDFKSTKGVHPDRDAYDDRAYLRIEIE